MGGCLQAPSWTSEPLRCREGRRRAARTLEGRSGSPPSAPPSRRQLRGSRGVHTAGPAAHCHFGNDAGDQGRYWLALIAKRSSDELDRVDRAGQMTAPGRRRHPFPARGGGFLPDRASFLDQLPVPTNDRDGVGGIKVGDLEFPFTGRGAPAGLWTRTIRMSPLSAGRPIRRRTRQPEPGRRGPSSGRRRQRHWYRPLSPRWDGSGSRPVPNVVMELTGCTGCRTDDVALFTRVCPEGTTHSRRQHVKAIPLTRRASLQREDALRAWTSNALAPPWSRLPVRASRPAQATRPRAAAESDVPPASFRQALAGARRRSFRSGTRSLGGAVARGEVQLVLAQPPAQPLRPHPTPCRRPARHPAPT